MAKPKSKDELIKVSRENFKKLNDLVDSFSEEEKTTEFPEGTMNRNMRDVLAHLHHWHLMLLDWYNIGMKGEKPDMPAKGYSWKDTPDLNRKIWEDYKGVKLEEVRNLLNESFSELQRIIEKHSNEELFEKRRYRWTGLTSLGAYFIANTSSHYNWACKLIKKAKK
jgi:hypothetical protein